MCGFIGKPKEQLQLWGPPKRTLPDGLMCVNFEVWAVLSHHPVFGSGPATWYIGIIKPSIGPWLRIRFLGIRESHPVRVLTIPPLQTSLASPITP